jgi:hypothetical protein
MKKRKGRGPYEPKYNRDSVNKAIEAAGRHGGKVPRKMAIAIHRLLKGRHG